MECIVRTPVKIAGRRRTPGDRVDLSGRQALYLLLSGKVEKAPAVAVKPTTKTGRPSKKPATTEGKSVDKEASDA